MVKVPFSTLLNAKCMCGAGVSKQETVDAGCRRRASGVLSHISLVNESLRSLVIALVNKFAVNNFDLFNSTNRTHEATLCGCEALLKMHRDRERGLSEGKQTLENEVLSLQ